MLKERITQSNNEEDKHTLQIQRQLHKLRAKSFFQKLKNKEDHVLCLSYDCQKNLVNPKIPDQIAYYSRQIYTFNFTIVQGSSKDKLTKDNVFTYTWMENDFSKGANQIASAVFHRLCQMDLSKYSSIQVFADGG